MSDFAATRTDLTGIPADIGIARGAKSSGLLTVGINGTDTVVQAARDTTFAAGDRVLVQRVGAVWVAVCRLDTAATADQPENATPPPAKPSTVTGTLTVAPVETRSYRSSGWRTDNADVYQGEYGGNGNHTGCAFYGSKPRSLSGATVTGASIKVRRPSKGGGASAQSTTLRLVTQATRPGGAPTLGSSTTGPRLKWGQTDNSFDIPTSWAQAMVDGTAGGLAVFDSGGSPYVILAGKGTWSAAFTLSIRWSRTT